MQSIATLTIDSREVATMIEKRHDHLIRDIKKYVEHLTAPNFGVSDFENAKLRFQKCSIANHLKFEVVNILTLFCGYVKICLYPQLAR